MPIRFNKQVMSGSQRSDSRVDHAKDSLVLSFERLRDNRLNTSQDILNPVNQLAIKKLPRRFFRSQSLHKAAMALRSPNNKTRKDNILHHADALLGNEVVVFPLCGQKEQIADDTAQGSCCAASEDAAYQDGNKSSLNNKEQTLNSLAPERQAPFGFQSRQRRK